MYVNPKSEREFKRLFRGYGTRLERISEDVNHSRLIRDTEQYLVAVESELKTVSERYKTLCAEVEAARTLIGYVSKRQTDTLSGSGKSEKSKQPTYTKTITDTAAEILSDGQSLHRNEIYERLVARGGIVIEGEHPVANVGARLSADDRFTSLGGGMWRLKFPQDSEESERSELPNEIDMPTLPSEGLLRG